MNSIALLKSMIYLARDNNCVFLMQKIEIWLVDTVAYSGVIQLMVRGQVRGQTVKDTRQRNSNHSSNI